MGIYEYTIEIDRTKLETNPELQNRLRDNEDHWRSIRFINMYGKRIIKIRSHWSTLDGMYIDSTTDLELTLEEYTFPRSDYLRIYSRQKLESNPKVFASLRLGGLKYYNWIKFKTIDRGVPVIKCYVREHKVDSPFVNKMKEYLYTRPTPQIKLLTNY